MTRTSEVSPIFAFSLTKGSAPAVKSNLPTSGNGFLSISTAIEVVPGTLLVISIGTTAPFSAICGASISTSLLGRGLPAPSAFSASAAAFAPRADDHGRGAFVRLEAEGDRRDGNGVGGGNRVESAWARLDRRPPRHAQHVALLGFPRRDQAECRRAHRDTARGDGDAM